MTRMMPSITRPTAKPINVPIPGVIAVPAAAQIAPIPAPAAAPPAGTSRPLSQSIPFLQASQIPTNIAGIPRIIPPIPAPIAAPTAPALRPPRFVPAVAIAPAIALSANAVEIQAAIPLPSRAKPPVPIKPPKIISAKLKPVSSVLIASITPVNSIVKPVIASVAPKTIVIGIVSPAVLSFSKYNRPSSNPLDNFHRAIPAPISPTRMRILPRRVLKKSAQLLISPVRPSHSIISSTICATRLSVRSPRKSYSGSSKSNPVPPKPSAPPPPPPELGSMTFNSSNPIVYFCSFLADSAASSRAVEASSAPPATELIPE